jgi:hypothetical protein
MRIRRFAAILALVATAPAVAQDSDPAYLDDRSTPELLVKSFYNAVSRFELGRAWGYLNPDSRPDYPSFFAQYEAIASAEPVIGFLHADGRANAVFYDLPVIVKFIDRDGTPSYQTGCIGVTWPLADLQDMGPYPMPYVNLGPLLEVEGPASAVPLPICD